MRPTGSLRFFFSPPHLNAIWTLLTKQLSAVASHYRQWLLKNASIELRALLSCRSTKHCVLIGQTVMWVTISTSSPCHHLTHNRLKVFIPNDIHTAHHPLFGERACHINLWKWSCFRVQGSQIFNSEWFWHFSSIIYHRRNDNRWP